MNKFALAILAMCLATVAVYAPNRTRSQITTDINTKFNDNAAGDITPQDLREVTKDIIDSVPTFTDEPKAAAPHTHVRADVTDLAVFGASGGSASIGLVPSPGGVAGTTKFLREDATWQTVSGGGGGTVTSVGLVAPTEFSVSGSPVTAAGNLGFAWQNVSARRVFRGPTSGSAAPTFVDLVALDISDSTVAGRAMLTSVNGPAQQALLGTTWEFDESAPPAAGWTLSSNGAGSGTTAIDAEQDTYGIHEGSTGTTATGRATMFRSALAVRFGGLAYTCRWRIRIPTLSTSSERYIVRVGLGDNASGDHTDGAYFVYDESTSANWRICTASNNSRTITTSSIAVPTGWELLEIVVNAAGTSVEFFVDGVSAGAPITATIPTGAGRSCGLMTHIIKSVGTTARTVQYDRVNIVATP